MIDIGIITGSGIDQLPGDQETYRVRNRFGETSVSVAEVGPWIVGSILRHQEGHHHLPHTIPHQANLVAFEQLGARAILATTAVRAVDSSLHLGRPVLFDDLFFPSNLLPNGAPCTVFDEPGGYEQGHLILSEPFSPRLRRRMELAAGSLNIEVASGGVYGHTNGPQFETRVEIRWLGGAGVAAVSQTCGPEAVLAGELEIPYMLAGFPVNYATGIKEPEAEEELDVLLAHSAKLLPQLVLRTAEMLEEEDLAFDHGYVYRFD